MALHDIIKQICHHFFFRYQLCDAKTRWAIELLARKSEDTITATAARQAELPLPVNEGR